MKQTKKPETMLQILERNQDATDLVGHVIFNRGNKSIQTITGNCPDMGCVTFKNDPRGSYWILTYGLRDSLTYTDITGMSARAALKAIGDYPIKMKEKWFKEDLKRALA